MSSSNCCFLTCIQISQEAGQVAWYSHLFQNFPQFIVIHTVKGFGIVNKAEIDVLLELSCIFHEGFQKGSYAGCYVNREFWKETQDTGGWGYLKKKGRQSGRPFALFSLVQESVLPPEM